AGMALIMLWMVLGAVGMIPALMRRPGSSAWMAVIGPGLASLLALGVRVIVARGRRRSLRLLDATGCRCCLACRHSLVGLGDEGRCPECGTPFVRHAVRIGWSRTYREMPMRGTGDRSS